MNIIDAVNSRKNFRRAGSQEWIRQDELCLTEQFTIVDVKANDWETLEPKIEISECDFDETAHQITCVHTNACCDKTILALKSALGFK